MNKFFHDRSFIISASIFIAGLVTMAFSLLLSSWPPLSRIGGMAVVAFCTYAITYMALNEEANKIKAQAVEFLYSETERIVLWLEQLQYYKKGRVYLRSGERKGDYEYCCLGVAQKCMGHEPTSPRQCVLNPNEWWHFGLRESNGFFAMPVTINLVHCTDLARVNDRVFTKDTNFTNMRKAMLLTMHLWVKDQSVLEELETVFGEEIAELRKQHEKSFHTYVI